MPDDRPLGGYALFIATYASLCTGFVRWLVRSGRPVPEHVRAGDLALVAIATHKASRLIAKDKVTSVLRAPFTIEQSSGPAGEVDESARGRGLRRALGEALTCPFCLGLWVASALTAGLLVAPRAVRWSAFALSALGISDFLQIAYRKAEDTL